MEVIEDVKCLKQAIKIECDNALNLLVQKRLQWDQCATSIPESLSISQCILQMICMKSKSILKLSDGVIPMQGCQPLIDFSSMLPIVRSAYELCFIFHNIFVETETETESEILLSLWKIKGLSSRQNIINIPNNFIEKAEKEKATINQLKDKIHKLVSILDISEQAAKDIPGILRYNGDNIKGFHFVKEDGKIIQISAHYAKDGIKEMPQFKDTAALYNWTSIHTHGTFLSVLQFGQAYNANYEVNILKTILTSIYLIAKTVKSDFLIVSEKYGG